MAAAKATWAASKLPPPLLRPNAFPLTLTLPPLGAAFLKSDAKLIFFLHSQNTNATMHSLGICPIFYDRLQHWFLNDFDHASHQLIPSVPAAFL
jgi:hypothetical protein